MVGIKQDFDEVKMAQIEDMAETINNVIKPFVTDCKYIQKPDHIRCIQLKPGLKLYYSNKEQCLRTSEELTNAGFKNRVAYNCDGNFWSIYVLNETSLEVSENVESRDRCL